MSRNEQREDDPSENYVSGQSNIDELNLGSSEDLKITNALDQDHLDELNALESEISANRYAVERNCGDQTEMVRHIHRLGDALYRRFRLLGTQADIEESVCVLQRATDLSYNDDVENAVCLNSLGVSLEGRFDYNGEFDDLESAINALQKAVDLTPDDRANKAMYLSDLGASLRTKFNQLGELSDLEDSISVMQRTVELTSGDNDAEAIHLSNLGSCLQSRFDYLDELADLESAISVKQNAVDLTPDGHTSKASYLNNLGNSLSSRFDCLGDLPDLESAIRAQRTAVELTPDNHSEKARRLNNLGTSLGSRFESLGKRADLEEAISALRRAVGLISNGHPEEARYLSNFGASLESRFSHFGKLDDINEAISAQQAAVDFTSDSNVAKPWHLSSLGISLESRFDRLGELVDLENAIIVKQNAVDLAPVGAKEEYLASLGSSLRKRFHHLGELSDLVQAIAVMQRAVDFIPDHHSMKAIYLNSLGSCLQSRFDDLGEVADIERAISTKRKAVDFTSDSHVAKPALLSSLGTSLLSRFKRLGEVTDLNEAIRAKQIAVDLTPDGHADKASHLDNLGISLQCRFDHSSGLSDLENAIFVKQKALDLTPDGIANKAKILTNLGFSLRSRFVHLGEIGDLERAISYHQNAVDLTADGHIEKAERLTNLGESLGIRYKRFEELSDFHRASLAFQSASGDHSSRPSVRLDAALRCAALCSKYGDSRLVVEAYERVLSLIPRVVWIGKGIHQRLDDLFIRIGEIVNISAAHAISAGEITMAFEWLEAGRNVVWTQILQLRAPIDELRMKDSKLADNLEKSALALEKAGRSPNGGEMRSSQLKAAQHTFEEQKSHVALALEYEKRIEEVRKLEGFKDFLLPKRIADLTPAAKNGPVAIINVHEIRCDALILQKDGSIKHVHLSDFSFAQAVEMQSTLLSCLNTGQARSRGQHRVGGGFDRISRILSSLRLLIVEPVLLALPDTFSAIDDIPHITWCTTGPLTFLPLHAAGIYNAASTATSLRNQVYKSIVSSSTPSVSMLLSHPTPDSPSESVPDVLGISQTKVPGYASIPGTQDEILSIQKQFGKLTWLDEDQASVNAVLESMDQHSVIHFACHGIQDAKEPLKSAFILSEGKLTLENLMAKNIRNADLAVLSACETATGDQWITEEAVHLTAGMLAAGFRSVVGTLWAISDKDAPVIFDAFYSKLREYQEDGKDWRLKTAYALHYAVQHLRETIGEDEFLRWLPFIHFGPA